MDCLVSVVVPVYKVEKYIHRCVDSILTQNFANFELILVDDGSLDISSMICDEYAKKDSRIYVIHKSNGGLSDARNAGIDWSFASGDSEWLTFIDSDDWIHPQYLEGLLIAAGIYHTDIAICDYLNPDSFCPFKYLKEYIMDYMNSEEFFVNHNTIATVAWGKIYKKSLFSQQRYPVGKLNEDEFLTYKLLFQNQNISFVRNQTYFYFRNTDGIMKSEWSPKKMDALEALNEQFKFFKSSSYQSAFSTVANKYIWFLKENYENLQNYRDYENKESAIKNIRKALRMCLRQKCVDKPIYKNERLYAIAYPYLIKLYFLKKRAKKKYNRLKSK